MSATGSGHASPGGASSYVDRSRGRYQGMAATDLPRWALPVAFAVFALIVWAGPYTHIGPWSAPGLTDIGVYERVVEGIRAGQLPYRDLDLEYPPGAAVLFWLAGLVPGVDLAQSFGRVMALTWALTTAAGTLAAAQLGYARGRQVLIGATLALTPLMLGSLMTTRYDAVVSAIVAWLIVAALAERWGWMWGLLVAATLLKIVPAALTPILLIWQAHRADWRSAWRAMLIAITAGLVLLAPVAIWAWDGLRFVVHFHTARGAQIESTASSVLLAWHSLTGHPVRIDSTFGSQGPVGSGVTTFAQVTMLLSLAAIVALIIGYARRLARVRAPRDARLLLAVLATTILALVVGSKVLSPQYLMWILPAPLLLAGRRGLVALAGTCATLIATQLYFPRLYWPLTRLETLPIWLLVLRNLLLIALLFACWPRRADDGAEPGSPASGKARAP